MKQLLEKYLFFFSCKSAASTVKRVKYQLQAFIRYLQVCGIPSFQQITTDVLVKWSCHLKEKGLSPFSIYDSQGVINGLLNWLHREEYLLVNPWPGNLKRKRPDYMPKHVPGQVKTRTFIDNLECRNMYPNRNRAIIELAYGSGLRVGELRQLNVCDIRSNELRITGKGIIERMVPIGSRARSSLECYLLTDRKKITGRHNPLEEALFVSYRGRRLSRYSYAWIMWQLRGNNKHMTMHTFRHACATHMLENGASVRVLQKLLGHGKLSSTQVYTRVRNRQLVKLLEEFHPRG